MNWREVWIMSLGFDPPVDYFPPLISAILVYILAMLFCYLFYQLSNMFLAGFLKELAQDFFTSMVFCTYCFGHVVVWTFHGSLEFCMLFVPLCTVTVFLFTQGDGTPLSTWYKYLSGQLSEWKFTAKIFIQTLAGFSAWELGYLIFTLDFNKSFASLFQYKDLEHCRSDLNIPVLAGFLLESIGVAYDFWMNEQTLTKYGPLDVALKFTNTALIVCFGVGMTGMYMQPVMASGRTLGCGTTSIFSHLLVYWVGPFIGVLLGIKLSKVFVFFAATSDNEPDKHSLKQKSEEESTTNHENGKHITASHKNGTHIKHRNKHK